MSFSMATETPCGSYFSAGEPRLAVGDRVRHGNVVGTIDDVLVTCGAVRYGIVEPGGRKWFADGDVLSHRPSGPNGRRERC